MRCLHGLLGADGHHHDGTATTISKAHLHLQHRLHPQFGMPLPICLHCSICQSLTRHGKPCQLRPRQQEVPCHTSPPLHTSCCPNLQLLTRCLVLPTFSGSRQAYLDMLSALNLAGAGGHLLRTAALTVGELSCAAATAQAQGFDMYLPNYLAEAQMPGRCFAACRLLDGWGAWRAHGRECKGGC